MAEETTGTPDPTLMATLLALQANGRLDSTVLSAVLASQSDPVALAKLIATELGRTQTQTASHQSLHESHPLGVTGLALRS